MLGSLFFNNDTIPSPVRLQFENRSNRDTLECRDIITAVYWPKHGLFINNGLPSDGQILMSPLAILVSILNLLGVKLKPTSVWTTVNHAPTCFRRGRYFTTSAQTEEERGMVKKQLRNRKLRSYGEKEWFQMRERHWLRQWVTCYPQPLLRGIFWTPTRLSSCT